MTCGERRDLLLLYAAGELEPAERDALRAHLATGCPLCAGALAEAEMIVAHAAGAIRPVSPPPAAIDRLIAHIQSSTAASAAPRRRAWGPALLSAAAAVAVTSGAFLYATRDALRFWRTDDLATITLASPTQPAAKGQVWWDRRHGNWRLTVADLESPASGREYELWFIPKDGVPIRGKTFGVSEGGDVKLVVTVPPSVGPGATAAITDEPLGGTDAPTGKVHLAGKFD